MGRKSRPAPFEMTGRGGGAERQEKASACSARNDGSGRRGFEWAGLAEVLMSAGRPSRNRMRVYCDLAAGEASRLIRSEANSNDPK